MQRIDYFVGVPLCGALGLLYRLKRLLFPCKHSKPSRLLCIELSEMGSAFLAYPMLKRAVERFGREQVFFLIFTKNRESVDLLNVIPYENVITISDKNFIAFALGTIKALLQIWKARIDTTMDMELFSRATAIISLLTGAQTRIGFDNFTDEGLYRGNFITHRVMLNNHQHISLNFLALLEALDADPTELPQLKKNVSGLMCDLPHLIPSDDERNYIWSKLTELAPGLTKQHELIVINPDPGLLALRGWPVERYKAVVERLLAERPQCYIVLMGLKRSGSYAAEVFPALSHERCINFCGVTRNLRDVITLFNMSKLLLTNDSGPGHLATLSRVNAIVLFGPESPQKYGPLGQTVTSLFANLNCSPCYSPANHRYSICKNNRCLQEISIEQVMTTARGYLNT
jgi:ADP-heptose:LPS heptosyltransferase